MSANLGRYAFFWCLIHILWSQGLAQLTFSSNPVYSGELVTLTFAYGSGAEVLYDVQVDAFSSTVNKGGLYCLVAPPNTTGVGVFAGAHFSGCPNAVGGVTNVSVALNATLSLELDYNCTATVTARKVTTTVPCGNGSLGVRVCPSPPNFQLNPIIFNDSDSGTVVCESRNGKPPANVWLMLVSSNGTVLTTYDNDSASLNLPVPMSNWYNATVTCRVTNHRCSNKGVTIGPDINVTSGIMINHIIKTNDPDIVCTNESNVVLNCAAYIRSYPGVLYRWTVPPEANLTSSLNLESLAVPQGHSGTFNCTATNNLTRASVMIVFTVSNACRTTTMAIPTLAPPLCEQCWIIGLVLGIIIVVIIAVILVVLGKRGHFSKGQKKPGVEPSGSDHQTDNGSHRGSRLYVYDGPASWTTSTEHRSDADAFHLGDRHAQASGDIASRKGRAPATSDVPVQDRHYTEDIRKPIRLLIAAEGVVSQLPLRALQWTAIVEYSDRSCSLNGILEKVEQAVTRSATKFKSVALLLRPAPVGVTLSEVDQAVLNSSTVKGEKGDKVRTFIARLAKICLDERVGTRMDILNYKTGKAPKRLSEALTGLLGIPTTVSQDQFGVETPIDDQGGHAVVADLYFDRNNLGEVVYAELELPTVKPPNQPRPVDEGVTYSEIRR